MSVKGLLLRYGWAIALPEWTRWSRIQPEVRVTTTAIAGALIAPFVVFVLPVGRLYWLMTGKRLPGPLGLVATPPRVLVNPFPESLPSEIRQLLERPENNWEPGPGDIRTGLASGLVSARPCSGRCRDGSIPRANQTLASAPHPRHARRARREVVSLIARAGMS